MTPNLLLEYFRETNLYKNFEEFVQDFCKLNLQLYSLETTSINHDIFFRLSLTSKIRKISSGDKNKHISIKKKTLQDCIESKKTVYFQSQRKTQCLLIPIVLKDILSGLILVEENPLYPLNKSQITSIERMISNLIHNINNHELNSFVECSGTELTHSNEIVNKVTRYISSRYNTPELTLAETARNCSVSYHYLSRLFKKELKTTFSQYLTDLRLSSSIKLLKDKRLTISEISNLCGFDDACYFGKVFKKRFRIPPAIFRSNLTKIHEKKALKRQNKAMVILQ